MEKNRRKEFAIDILVDIVGNLLIAIGVYNFAANSGFPVAGISGIAMIFYHLFGSLLVMVSQKKRLSLGQKVQ